MAFKITIVRFAMAQNAYQKYIATTIATNVSEESVAYISEHAQELQGVEVMDDTIRKYNNSEYFASILGYTGKISSEEYSKLSETDDSYTTNDVVGKGGIEQYMELDLQGEKGYTKMYVDNMGRPREVIEQQDAKAGNDVYLTIDRDLQIATYKLMEQQLAGIITKFLVNEDVDPATVKDGSKKPIPVKNAYYQLILSLIHI